MNFKLLFITALIVVLTACGGAEERKAVYMEKAKSSIEAGDLDKARIELKNVLQIDPKDGEAYYQLGTVHEQQKDYRKAYRNYLRAEELSPELLENHAKLGRFYLLLMNDSDKAQEKIDLILSSEPDNSEGLMLKAALMLKNKNKAGAIDITQAVIGRYPGHLEGVTLLTTLYINDNKYEEAIVLLDNALKDKPDNERINQLLALTLVKNKQYERAEAVYKKHLERNPDSSASYNNLAAFYHQIDSKDKAESILRASIENDPDDIQRQLVLIKYIKEAKGIDEAIVETNKLIDRNNSLGKLRAALAELYLLDGDKVSATKVLIDAVNEFSEEVTGIESRASLAAIYITDKDYSKAKEVVEDAITISPNDPKINLLRAKLALNEEDMETAIIALRIVTKETPENIDAYFLLANIYQFENNDEQLRSTLNNAFENNKTNAENLLKLVQVVLSRDVELAERVVDHYNSLKESDYQGLSIKAQILNQKKEYSEAYSISENLMELYPGEPNGYLQSMAYLGQTKDVGKAISTLEKGYINVKDNRKILTLLTQLQVSDKKFDVVEKRIKTELNINPEDEDLKLLLSKVYLTNNNVDAAEDILKEVVDTDSVTEDAYLLLARIYQSREDESSVEKILLKGKENIPSSVNIPLRLAAIYEFNNDYSAAIEIYRELHILQPDNLVIINNLASLLSDHGNGKSDLEQAKMLADKLLENKQPVFLDTIGWVSYRLGDYQNAITFLKQVVEKNPDVNVFNYHLGMAYKMSGNKVQARIYLEKSFADNKPFKEKSLAEAALKDL